MLKSSIWLINRSLSGATTPGQSGRGSDGNKGYSSFPQSSSITVASPSDCLVSYSGNMEGILPLFHRCSRWILQLQPTGPVFD